MESYETSNYWEKGTESEYNGLDSGTMVLTQSADVVSITNKVRPRNL